MSRFRVLQVAPVVRLLELVGLACLCWGNVLWMDGARWSAGAVDVAGLALARACRTKEQRLELES